MTKPPRKPHVASLLAIASMALSPIGWTQASDPAAVTSPKNILFIAADDLNCDINTFGASHVITPNLDRLAKMGTRFDNAFCQQPLCGPSRVSIMTGLRPNTTRCFALKDNFRDRKPDAVTLGEFFKLKGYYSGRVGKIYHHGNPGDIGTNGNDDAQTWTERFNPAGIDKIHEEKIIRYPGGITGRRNQLGVSMAWWDPVSEDDEHTDGKVASKAIELIEAHKDKPFFIAAGFFNPHCPYVAPRKYFDLYDIDDITLPDAEQAREDLKDVPPMAIRNDAKWPFRGVSVEEAKQCKLAYYASVSFVDAQVGRLLDALEKNGLMDDTIIVFWSDHGYFLGEKGLWYKRKAFERSARAPLIIVTPDGTKGASCSKPVEMLDMYPTLVDSADFEVPTALEGRSLRPLLQDANASWDHPAITQVHFSPNAQGYSLRNDRWRYTEWNRGKAGIELYDHQNDPEEITNLAPRPEHAEMIRTLASQLRAYSDTYQPKKNNRDHR
ncbi:MAG: sulfatase [Verrucomicrobiales bacterium]|nr:sulfatase [Verrucomicrobiota bacterium JB025]